MSVQVQLRRDTTTNVLTHTPTAGEIWVKITDGWGIVVGDGATSGGISVPVTLFVGNGGSTNNSNTGSGAFVNHTPTFTIPANFMTNARAFRVTACFYAVTGAAAPTLTARLLLGSTVIAQTSAPTPLVNLPGDGSSLEFLFQATAAPGAAVNVQCSLLAAALFAGGQVQTNTTLQPVAVATNAAQAVTIATQWTTPGTGTNTIALNQLIIEALN